MKEFADAILLNIAAAIIFWMVFAFLPERGRRNKLRPRLELAIYQVYGTIFTLLDSVMRPNAHSPSSFQNKIKGNKLSADDIELGLQNKCLNESFLYDDNVNRFLIPIGKQLLEERRRIGRSIDRVFAFSGYLTTAEILLLERIRGKLEVYDLERQAAVQMGELQYLPIDPCLSYMKETLSELYELFAQLQEIAFSNKYEDRDIVLDKVQCYYEQGQYRRCKRLIRSRQARYPADRIWLEFYLFLCEQKSGDTRRARQRLERILETKPHLVSSRGFLANATHDCGVREILEQHYTEAEIAEFDLVVRREIEEQSGFIEQANRLREYYRQKRALQAKANHR